MTDTADHAALRTAEAEITHRRELLADADGRAQALADALEWILPLAKGYAAAHQVGVNAEIVAAAEERLTVYRECRRYEDDTTAR